MKRLFPSWIPLVLILSFALIALPAFSAWQDMDFGLSLFFADDLRLDREKSPDFNFSLFKKYQRENDEKPLVHLHGIAVLVKLIKRSDDLKAVELKELARAYFKPPAYSEAHRYKVLDQVFAEGLLLTIDQTADKKNRQDKEFEDLVLKAEDVLGETPEYWLVKGILFNFLADRPNAYFSPMKPQEDLKRAGALASSDPHFLYVLGQAYRLLGAGEQTLFFAVQAFEKAAALTPANGRLQNTLLGLYMGLHETYQPQRKSEPFWLEEVVYKKVLTMYPNNPHAMNNLGYLYAEYGVHRQQAEQLCRKAVEQMPNSASFRDSFGWALFKNGNSPAAETELLKSISLNADSYDPFYHLGTVYYVTKQFDRAIEMYEKAITIKPTAAESLNNYAYLLTELDRDLDKAQQMAARAAAMEPNNPSYIDTLAWAEFKKGNAPEALRLLTRAAQLAPDVGEILGHLGRVYLHLRQFDRAIEQLKLAYKADPNQEALQRDLYLAIQTRAVFGAFAEYHQLFAGKADSRHLTSILLQLIRMYQEEGNFREAIQLSQTCEKIKRGEIPLGKPVFDFYTLDIASETAATENSTGSGSDIISTGTLDLDQESGLEGTEFPEVARIPLAVNLGPWAINRLNQLLLARPELNSLGISLFIRNGLKPFRSSVFRVDLPGMSEKNPIQALSYHLGLYGCVLTPVESEIGTRACQGVFNRHRIWAVQYKDSLLVGGGEFPGRAEIELLSRTFPWQELGVIAFLLDWETLVRAIPRPALPLVHAFLGNPLGDFHRLYARFTREGGEIREVSLLQPTGPVTPPFMKRLAEDLFFYRVLLARVGIKASIRVEANDNGVRLTTSYLGFKDHWAHAREYLAPIFLLLRGSIDSTWCSLRRSFFSSDLSQLKEICPAGGNVRLQAELGTLVCNQHPGFGFFPMPVTSLDRCLFSRNRLEILIHNMPRIASGTGEIGGLLERLKIDYNVTPCPAGGVFSYLQDGSISCSAHPGPSLETPQNQPKKE